MSNKKINTVCTLCGRCGCGIEVTLDNNTVVNIEGNKNHPESHGYLCLKGRAIKEILYSPDRLKCPLKRIGKRGEGKWQEISWDEAYHLITDKLKHTKSTYGAEAVWFHTGVSHDVCAGEVCRNYLHRLANVFGSPNLSCQYDNCYGPRVVPMVHTLGAIFAPDVENSRCILLWGINQADSAPPRSIKILKAVKKGACLIHVDPRSTLLSEKADIHLQLRPGTDGALALGFLNVIITDKLYDAEFIAEWTTGFEELKKMIREYPPDKVEKITGVSKEVIRKAAVMYSTHKPACIFTGNGLDQHTGSSQAVRAISIIMAITGNLDVPGGNVQLIPTSLSKNSVPLHEMLPKEAAEKRLGNELLITRSEFTRFAHPNTAINAILDERPYPVKALMVMKSNMLLSCPNSQRIKKALEKLDFLAVTDLFLTETAQMADVVLPACTFLEQTYYATYDAGTDLKPDNPGLLMLRSQVIPPLYESKPDWRIIFELANRMGYEKYFPWGSMQEVIDFELKPTGITYKELSNSPGGIVYRKYPIMYRKYKKMGFMTPSKKVEIFSSTYQEEGIDALPVYHEPAESPSGNPRLAKKYPFVLTTGAKINVYVHSQMRNIPSLRNKMPENIAEINPDPARIIGLADGDMAVIETKRAAVKCRVKVTDKIRPDTILVYFGFGNSNANLLTDDTVWDPVTGSSPMRSGLCRILKPR